MITARKYYEFNEVLPLIKEKTGKGTNFEALKDFTRISFNNAFEDIYNSLVLKYKGYGVIYRDFIAPYQSEPAELTIDDDDVIRFIDKIVIIYNETKDRYLQLLKYYDDANNKLMDKMETESVQRYNDTPQNGGYFDDDGHTTSITTNTSKSDLTPIIDRLTDIRNKMVDIKKEWADEFKGLFIIID